MRRLDSIGPAHLRGHAYQFLAVDSPIHRLGAGWKLAFGVAMGAGAAAARDPWALLGLFLVNMAYYFLARLGLGALWLDVRFFLLQMMIILGLYVMRDGPAHGFWPGLRTGLQVLLFFLPGAVMLRTTQASTMIRDLKSVLPARFAFILFTSLRFVPFFAAELREIAMAQRLRGAPLAPRQWIKPGNWPDVIQCLMVPLIVRALKTANDAALSAEARGIGGRFERTFERDARFQEDRALEPKRECEE